MIHRKYDKDDWGNIEFGLITILIWACLIALFALVFYWAYGKWDESSQTLGQFGDFFGGILNPLFSYTSLVLLAFSFIYTKEAFRLSTEGVRAALLQTQMNFDMQRIERIDNEKKSRLDLTIIWHQNWMSPQMSMLKMNVYGEIQSCISNTVGDFHSAFIGGLRNSANVQTRMTYYEIKEVVRSIHHAVTYLENGLVDKDLFLQLFENDLRQWHSVLSRLDMRGESCDESQESHSEESERKDLVERLARVIGIEATQ